MTFDYVGLGRKVIVELLVASWGKTKDEAKSIVDHLSDEVVMDITRTKDAAIEGVRRLVGKIK